jgi:hypothetical protein
MSKDDPIRPRTEYSVQLPCTPETFADFISSLLGSPQTIERRFTGAFELTRADVENLYHLIQQRVEQQNKASLVEFAVNIFYHDGSSVRLTGLRDFQHYTEVRSLVSVGVHLTWVYLITFQDKAAPEKQQIDLTFLSGRHNDPEEGSYIVVQNISTGRINLRIAHTARTWGVDLESLLTGHIDSLFKKESGAKIFIIRHSNKLGLIAGLVTYLIVVFGTFFATHRFAEWQLDKIKAVTTLQITEKIDFLAARYAEGSWTQFNLLLTVFLLAAIIGAIAIAAWVSVSAENRPRSFVLLSRKAEEDRVKALRKRQRQWLNFGASMITSILSGFVANALFAWAITLVK